MLNLGVVHTKSLSVTKKCAVRAEVFTVKVAGLVCMARIFSSPAGQMPSSVRLTSLPSNDGLAVQQLESELLYKNGRSASS